MDGAPRAGNGFVMLAVTHFAATMLALVEFVLVQAVAVGLTTGVYFLIPLLETGAQASFEDWRKIFQVVSPTVGISGGAGIVLSSIIYARQAQQSESRRQEEQAKRQEEQTKRQEEQAKRQAAEADARVAQAEAETAQARAEAAQARAEAAQANERAALAEVQRLRTQLAELENGNSDHPTAS